MNIYNNQKNTVIVNPRSWFKRHFILYTKEEGGCVKQFQILGTDPVEVADDKCTRVERSYFGHCNNKTTVCVETPPDAWGGGGGWLSKMKKLKL
jgi:hypothetical protein